MTVSETACSQRTPGCHRKHMPCGMNIDERIVSIILSMTNRSPPTSGPAPPNAWTLLISETVLKLVQLRASRTLGVRCKGKLRCNVVVLDCVLHQLCDGVQAKRFHRVVAMKLHGPGRDTKRVGNLLGALSF